MTRWEMLAGLLGFVTVWATVPLLLAGCRRRMARNRPAELHHGNGSTVPRFGGAAIAMAFFAVQALAAVVNPEFWATLRLHPVIPLSGLAMFGLGFWDDLKPLGARKKLIVQILIALLVGVGGAGIQIFRVPFTGQIISLGSWGYVATVLWLVSFTNLINLIDGMDGLAAGISLMLMVLLGYVGAETAGTQMVIAGMGGALLGFLRYNFPPARIYLGDGGAYFLGYQIGLFALISSHKGEVMAALIAPLFVLALPILDTGLAILRRGLRGLPLFRPDRRHLHHHLLDSGLSQFKVVIGFYALTLMFLVLGMAAYWSRGHLVPALFGISVLILLGFASCFQFSRRWFAIGRMFENSLKMRREIEYALCLSKWLALEGKRCGDVETLWATLIIAAEKLGFSMVRIQLADGERTWFREASPKPGQRELPQARRHFVRHSLMQGRCGVLEFEAPGEAGENVAGGRQRNWDRPTITDEGLFNTVSELLAEGWIKSAQHCLEHEERPLQFAANSEAVARFSSTARSTLGVPFSSPEKSG